MDELRSTLVKVKIFGQEYHIRSNEEDKVRQIASYLNDQFESMKKDPSALNRLDVAVMVAFKATNDLFSTQEELTRLKARIEKTSSALSVKIDSQLKNDREPDSE